MAKERGPWQGPVPCGFPTSTVVLITFSAVGAVTAALGVNTPEWLLAIMIILASKPGSSLPQVFQGSEGQRSASFSRCPRAVTRLTGEPFGSARGIGHHVEARRGGADDVFMVGPLEIVVDEVDDGIDRGLRVGRGLHAQFEYFADGGGESGEGLDEQLVHACEVVGHRAERRAGESGDLPVGGAHDTFPGDAVQGRVDDPVSPAGVVATVHHSWRMTRAGLPTAMTFEGRFVVTTEPAPTTVLSPMVIPGRTMTPPPSQRLSPIVIGWAASSLSRRGCA